MTLFGFCNGRASGAPRRLSRQTPAKGSLLAALPMGVAMNKSKFRFAPLALLLVAVAARADTLADWADKTTEIATDGPNTIRTLALAQNAVYEAVNAITSRYPRDRLDLGPAAGASIDAAIVAASRTVLLHEAPALKAQVDAAYEPALRAL